MHPDMKVALDKVVVAAVAELEVPQPLAEIIVNTTLICTKLQVLGTTEKGRMVNMHEACEKIQNEVAVVAFLAFDLAEQIPSGVIVPAGEHAVEQKQKYTQEFRTKVMTWFEAKLTPIIQHYFLGLQPGQKANQDRQWKNFIV